jgi:hypothetical protein
MLAQRNTAIGFLVLSGNQIRISSFNSTRLQGQSLGFRKCILSTKKMHGTIGECSLRPFFLVGLRDRRCWNSWFRKNKKNWNCFFFLLSFFGGFELGSSALTSSTLKWLHRIQCGFNTVILATSSTEVTILKDSVIQFTYRYSKSSISKTTCSVLWYLIFFTISDRRWMSVQFFKKNNTSCPGSAMLLCYARIGKYPINVGSSFITILITVSFSCFTANRPRWRISDVSWINAGCEFGSKEITCIKYTIQVQRGRPQTTFGGKFKRMYWQFVYHKFFYKLLSKNEWSSIPTLPSTEAFQWKPQCLIPYTQEFSRKRQYFVFEAHFTFFARINVRVSGLKLTFENVAMFA